MAATQGIRAQRASLEIPEKGGSRVAISIAQPLKVEMGLPVTLVFPAVQAILLTHLTLGSILGIQEMCISAIAAEEIARSSTAALGSRRKGIPDLVVCPYLG